MKRTRIHHCRWCNKRVFVDKEFWTERKRKSDGALVPMLVQKAVYDLEGEVECEWSETDGQHDEDDAIIAVMAGRPTVMLR